MRKLPALTMIWARLLGLIQSEINFLIAFVRGEKQKSLGLIKAIYPAGLADSEARTDALSYLKPTNGPRSDAR